MFGQFVLRLSLLSALVACDAPAALLYVVNADGGSVQTVTDTGSVSTLISGLTAPRSIAFLNPDVLLLAGNDEIGQYDAYTGAYLGSLATLYGVDSVVTDLMGNIYAASSALGEIHQYDSAGNLVASVTGLSAPGTLALDGAGRLFATHVDGTLGTIGSRYAAAGLAFVDNFVTGNLNVPMGAMYRNGTLYLTDLFTGVDQVDELGNVTPFAHSDLSFPWGITFGADGYFYVASSADGLIQRFDTNGVYQDTLASGFLTPAGIAFSTVPEPGTYALVAGGLMVMAWRRRRAAGCVR